jgi:hypothetical protein
MTNIEKLLIHIKGELSLQGELINYMTKENFIMNDSDINKLFPSHNIVLSKNVMSDATVLARAQQLTNIVSLVNGLVGGVGGYINDNTILTIGNAQTVLDLGAGVINIEEIQNFMFETEKVLKDEVANINTLRSTLKIVGDKPLNSLLRLYNELSHENTVVIDAIRNSYDANIPLPPLENLITSIQNYPEPPADYKFIDKGSTIQRLGQITTTVTKPKTYKNEENTILEGNLKTAIDFHFNRVNSINPIEDRYERSIDGYDNIPYISDTDSNSVNSVKSEPLRQNSTLGSVSSGSVFNSNSDKTSKTGEVISENSSIYQPSRHTDSTLGSVSSGSVFNSNSDKTSKTCEVTSKKSSINDSHQQTDNTILNEESSESVSKASLKSNDTILMINY